MFASTFLPVTPGPTDLLVCLRANRGELEDMGVRRLALFGSRARGEAGSASDVEIAVVFDASVRRDTLAYFGIRQRVEDWLSAILGLRVDLSDEAMQREKVREQFEHDRVYAF